MVNLKRFFSDPSVSKAENSSQTSCNKIADAGSVPMCKASEDSQGADVIKRRARIPVFMFDRPLTTEVEFVVDARYHSLKVIGHGSFGVVARAVDSRTSGSVAIKKIISAFSSSKSARRVLREVRLLRHLKHPNIVRLLDIDIPNHYRSWNEVYLTTPLLKMDLHTALKKNLIFSVKLKKTVAFQILTAIAHMHSLGLMHRDVKSRNVVLDEKWNVQLCDLGSARFFSKFGHQDDLVRSEELDDKHEPGLSVDCTTPVQAAPEISLNMEYDSMVDVWAAGCVIGQILKCDHEGLFDSTSRNGHLSEILFLVEHPTDDDLDVLPNHARWMVKRLIRGSSLLRRDSAPRASMIHSKLGKDMDPLAVDLVEKMLQFSPSKRLTACQALDHPWFDDVRVADCAPKESYDFRNSEPRRNATRAQLKQLVWHEVLSFRPASENSEESR